MKLVNVIVAAALATGMVACGENSSSSKNNNNNPAGPTLSSQFGEELWILNPTAGDNSETGTCYGKAEIDALNTFDAAERVLFGLGYEDGAAAADIPTLGADSFIFHHATWNGFIDGKFGNAYQQMTVSNEDETCATLTTIQAADKVAAMRTILDGIEYVAWDLDSSENVTEEIIISVSSDEEADVNGLIDIYDNLPADKTNVVLGERAEDGTKIQDDQGVDIASTDLLNEPAAGSDELQVVETSFAAAGEKARQDRFEALVTSEDGSMNVELKLTQFAAPAQGDEAQTHPEYNMVDEYEVSVSVTTGEDAAAVTTVTSYIFLPQTADSTVRGALYSFDHSNTDDDNNIIRGENAEDSYLPEGAERGSEIEDVDLF